MDSRFSTLHSKAIAEDGRGSDGSLTFYEFIEFRREDNVLDKKTKI